MADDPQIILRNAKTSWVAARDALKSKDPWDKEVEFHRRDARRHLLHLIFEFAYSPQTLAMDNQMWLETSHACIAVYRSRIATLDKAVAARSAPAQSRPSGPNPVVEHRKLVQRFRQFIAEEEKFWTTFILRFARAFALEEAQPYVDALQLNRQANGQPNGNIHLDEDVGTGRNTPFPLETKPLAPPPTQREKKIIMLVKAIISLGDLARYKEQYNERQGRPKAGAEDVPPRWATKNSRKAGENVPRPRNYTRAHACYTQARLLLPDAGQASHQLAILASNQLDTFGAILHYYRSICVKQPFVMAQDNLYKTLAKVYEAHIAESSELAKDDDAPRAVVDRFKRDVVALHCLWRAEKATDAELLSHTQYTLSRFSKLLEERLLPIGLVVKVYTAALGALWTFRMTRKSESSKPSLSKTSTALKECTVLTHVMDLHLALLKLATAQLDPATLPTTGTAQNGTTLPKPAPAEKITAVLRRILQSLRVASRWVMASADYLYRSANPDKAPPALLRTVGEFWSSYAAFATALDAAFGERSTGYLGAINVVLLEEDVELEGFTPLKGSLKRRRVGAKDKAVKGLLNQVHPNDEYLLRIRDILEDAEALAKSEVTPLKLQSGVYISSTEAFTPVAETPPHHEHHSLSPPRSAEQANGRVEHPAPAIEVPPPMKAAESPEDDVASVSTEDPVTLAMRATLGTSEDGFDDEEEEEQILFPQGTWSGFNSLSMEPNSLYPFLPPRDPHAFQLADLTRSNLQYSPYVPTMMQHRPQYVAPQYDVFAPASPLYTHVGMVPQPVGAMNHYHEMPSAYSANIHSLGNGVLPSNSPRMNQPILSLGQNQPVYTSPHRGAGSLSPGNPHTNGAATLPTSQAPFTPRQQRGDRLSISGNTPGATIGARDASPNATPPRTAQDLLLRVLGTTPNAPSPTNMHNGGSSSSNVVGRPRLSTSPTRVNSSGSSPDGHRPAPLLFGPSAGNSIWAP